MYASIKTGVKEDDMICLKCDCEKFEVGEAGVRQEFRGENLTVRTPVMVCQNCGWQTVGKGQLDELRKRTADAYRQKHNLLMSTQIHAHREALGMSQREFAKALGVGEASVKRWETWLVQEKSSDELIRMKVAQLLEERNLEEMLNSWLQGCCAKGSVIIKGGGIQLWPNPKAIQPKWIMSAPKATQMRFHRSRVSYVTNLPVTA